MPGGVGGGGIKEVSSIHVYQFPKSGVLCLSYVSVLLEANNYGMGYSMPNQHKKYMTPPDLVHEEKAHVYG